MSVTCVSVVIPIYNVVKFLDEAIRSVLSDEYPDIEIVVVNDGSNSHDSIKIPEICARYPQVKLVHQVNQGQAQARRTGVMNARGDYIIFLDADDILLPGAVSYLAQHMDAHPDAVGVYGTKIRMEEDGAFLPGSLRPAKESAASGDVVPALLLGAPLFSHGNICVRRQFLEKLDFPKNIRQGEDWVTWCRLALMGDIIYTGERTLLALRNHSNNVSNEVLDKPSELFKMFKFVYRDPAFIERLGRRRLQAYRDHHRWQIHIYLRYRYRDNKQHFRVWKQSVILWLLPPLRSDKIRVLHVVKWFYAGGAERILSSVLEHSDHDKFEHIVLSLSDQGERLGAVQEMLGIPYKSFELVPGKFDYKNYWRCFQFIRKTKPDVIKTWLPPANIAGGMAAKLLRKPLIWGIHNVHVEKTYPFDVRLQTKLARFLPDLVVCCSQLVYDTCQQFGYHKNLLTVINNGTDTEFFTPQPEARKKIRKELGIADDVILIGMAAECTPIKRHSHFLVAAKLLSLSFPNVHFLLCGKDTSASNYALKNYIEFLEMNERVHLLGIRNDMPDIYSALDIHTLNSRAESFGLAVTEAMACETLCVATDVGMMQELLEDVGEVYALEDGPHSLVNAWEKMMSLSDTQKRERLKNGRQRIVEHYSIVNTAKAYDALYEQFGNG